VKGDSSLLVQMCEVSLISLEMEGEWSLSGGGSRADHVNIGSGLDASENYASKAEKKIAYLTRFAPGMPHIISHVQCFSAKIGCSPGNAPLHN